MSDVWGGDTDMASRCSKLLHMMRSVRIGTWGVKLIGRKLTARTFLHPKNRPKCRTIPHQSMG